MFAALLNFDPKLMAGGARIADTTRLIEVFHCFDTEFHTESRTRFAMIEPLISI